MTDEAEPTARWTKGDLTAVLPLCLLLAFLVLPQQLQNDDLFRAGAVNLLRDGVVPGSLQYQYSLVQPVLALPINVVLDGLGFGIRSFTLISWSWVAGWAALMWWLLRRERDGSYATKVVVLCLVSVTAANVVGFSGDVFSMALISGGVLLAYLGRSATGRTVGWLLAVVAAANTPALVLALGVVALTAALQRRRVRYLLAPAAAVALVAAEATWVEGSLTLTKYSSEGNRGEVPRLPWGEVEGFGWPLWSGLLAVLFSFGRGLIFFLPLWVAGPPPSTEPTDELHRVERALWLGVIVLIPFYAMWWAWYAGVAFGPRFFLLGTVPTAMAAVRLLTSPTHTPARIAILIVAIALSTWIAIVAVGFGQSDTAFATCASGGSFELQTLCLYTPEYSNLWIPIWSDDAFAKRSLPFVAVALVAVTFVVYRPAVELVGAGRRRLAARTSGLWSGWRF